MWKHLVYGAVLLSAAMAWGGEAKSLDGTYVGQKYEPGTTFTYHVYIPKQYDPSQGAALFFGFDGLYALHRDVMEKLIDEGAMPVCVCVGLDAGWLYPPEGAAPEAKRRFMRGLEYDQIGPEFPNFVVEEFLPWLIAKEKLNILPSPDMHMVSGGSSGGIAAWNMAWYRNDYFRRAFLCSPTFSSIRSGEEPMVIARKAETRPIRVYSTQGTNEPNLWAGDSFVAAKFGESAMNFAGYDMKHELFPGGGHGVGAGDPAVMERVYRFLWANWKTEPVKALHNQEYMNSQIDFGTAWAETTDPMPNNPAVETAAGTYSFAGSEIFLTDRNGVKKQVASGFGKITSIALSSDQWRLYIADATKRLVFAMTVLPDGRLAQKHNHTPLHLSWQCSEQGGADLCVDVSDRLYIATELGVQSCRSMGMIDSIYTLPGDLPVVQVAFGGENFSTLYAKAANGKIFKRPWKIAGTQSSATPTTPGTEDYYH